MSILRESAKGQPCLVRLQVCNCIPATTVLAHLNGAGIALKHDDIFGAFACSACHDEIDGRTRLLPRDVVLMAFFWGMQRTQQFWRDNGYIQISRPELPKVSTFGLGGDFF